MVELGDNSCLVAKKVVHIPARIRAAKESLNGDTVPLILRAKHLPTGARTHLFKDFQLSEGDKPVFQIWVGIQQLLQLVCVGSISTEHFRNALGAQEWSGELFASMRAVLPAVPHHEKDEDSNGNYSANARQD